MTLQLLRSEFPYIWGKFDFLFFQCGWSLCPERSCGISPWVTITLKNSNLWEAGHFAQEGAAGFLLEWQLHCNPYLWEACHFDQEGAALFLLEWQLHCNPNLWEVGHFAQEGAAGFLLEWQLHCNPNLWEAGHFSQDGAARFLLEWQLRCNPNLWEAGHFAQEGAAGFLLEWGGGCWCCPTWGPPSCRVHVRALPWGGAGQGRPVPRGDAPLPDTDNTVQAVKTLVWKVKWGWDVWTCVL